MPICSAPHPQMLRALVLALAVCAAAASEGDGGPFEWAGIFETPKAEYRWIAQAAGGEYVDPGMLFVAMPATAANADELTRLKETAVRKMTASPAEGGYGACAEVEPGGEGTIAPTADKCYKLKFFGNTLDSIFKVPTAGVPAVAFFAQHVPTEFEDTEHYFKDMEGTDIEPSAEDAPEEEEKAKPWGTAIGAAIVVNLVTLTGVLMLVPAIKGLVDQYPLIFTVVLNAFAAGALLAAAFFLLLYESTHLIPIDANNTEAEASAAWGCMILLGFLTSTVIDSVVAALSGHGEPPAALEPAQLSTTEAGQVPNKSTLPMPLPMSYGPAAFGGMPMAHGMPTLAHGGTLMQQSKIPVVMGSGFGVDAKVEDGNVVDENADGVVSLSKQRRVLASVLIGDFMHNFCDGIFIGAGFMNCDATMGWSITAATIYHEIAQEVSDYCVLTDPAQGNLKAFKALGLNFVSGLSVVLGVLVILSQDISNYAQGCILAFGGGVYVQVGAAECMPRVWALSKTIQLRALSFAGFFIGAMAIGLVLLDHKHCTAGGGHDGHIH